MTFETKAMADAWQGYLQTLEFARSTLFGQDVCKDPSVREAAHYALHQVQATAFNMAIAPRQAYPRFDIHLFSEPMLYPWLLNNPDFLYRMVYLDGARTYRVRGRRHNTCWLDFQVFSHFWTEPENEMKTLGSYDIDRFQIASDGSFELMLGPTPRGSNWIALDPTAPRHAIMVREAFLDWANETRTELRIECLDEGPPAPVQHSESAMIERIEAANRLIRFTVGRFMAMSVPKAREAFGLHKFFQPGVGGNSGTNPEAIYWQAIYDLQADEAIVIETEVPECLYWGVQLTDAFVATTEYIYHQSSLNAHQAHISSDGRFRAVLSKQDPGAPNWLDPVENTYGTIFLRWYRAGENKTPTLTKVPFDKLWGLLPKDTPRMDREARNQALRERRDAALQRYGY